jgi:hypothetical protein
MPAGRRLPWLAWAAIVAGAVGSSAAQPANVDNGTVDQGRGAVEPGTIEIYEHYGTYTLDAPPPDMRPLVLQVPEKFRYGLSRGQARNWGVNILTYYPSFTSPLDPENAKFGLRCVGICNGQVLISVENRTHSISASIPNMGEFIAQSILRWAKSPPYPPNVTVRDLKPPFDSFDQGFERTTVSLRKNGGTRSPARVQRFYFKKAADRTHNDLAAECQFSMDKSRTTCVLHFSLRCDSRIYVAVHGLDGSFLNESTEIKDKSDAFISNMVQEPPCH